MSSSGSGLKGSQLLSAQDAGKKATDWISSYFKAMGQSVDVKLVSSNETKSGVYQFEVEITSSQGQSTAAYYVTKDGKLFFPQGIDITSQPSTTPQPPTEIPKTDEPTVRLFVMSFCPYGQQAENTMKSVVDLLGSSVTIEPHFIVSVSGTTVSSLHGDYEANEDMRQACIWKYNGQSAFWKYAYYLDKNCNKTNVDTCWKDAARNAGINASSIETCASNEGLDLMKDEQSLSSQYGVSGSPTLMINGVESQAAYQYGNSEAYKEAICSGFKTQPPACSQTLSNTTTSASGGCTQ